MLVLREAPGQLHADSPIRSSASRWVNYQQPDSLRLFSQLSSDLLLTTFLPGFTMT